MKIIIIAGLVAVLSACAATPSVTGADDTATLNTLTTTCKKPYRLTQDCSIWSGATRKIDLGGFIVKTGASADGKVVLVMDSNLVSNTYADLLTLNSPTHSAASNNSFYAVKRLLDKAGIKILRIRPLRSFGNVDGYVLELKSDGYSMLKKYTKKQ